MNKLYLFLIECLSTKHYYLSSLTVAFTLLITVDYIGSLCVKYSLNEALQRSFNSVSVCSVVGCVLRNLTYKGAFLILLPPSGLLSAPSQVCQTSPSVKHEYPCCALEMP